MSRATPIAATDLVRPRRPRFRLLAIIRVLAVLCVCSLLSLWWLLQATRARAADVLVELGEQVMRLPGADYSSGLQQLWLNGLELQLESGSSELPPLEVVARFRQACVSHAAVQLNGEERKAVEPLMKAGWLRSALDGVLIEEGEGGTAVVCIDPLGKPWDVLSMSEAARRFVSSGDLQELGQLRYAYVRKTERGSVFLTMWTHGPARLLEQFPRDRDAPGADFPGVARVPGSQRFLSARLTESVLAIYAHRSGTLEELGALYREELKASGYQSLEKYARGKGSLGYGFERRGQQVVLSLAEAEGVILATLLSQP